MWIRCSAWPALQAATAPLVVAVVGVSLFLGPHGIKIADLGVLLDLHPLLQAELALLWSLAMAPAASAALLAPGLHYLRGLPSPLWMRVLSLLLILLFLHAPVSILFFAAGKPAIALGLLGAGLGLSTSFLLPSYRRWESLLSLALACGLLTGLALGESEMALALGFAAAALLLPRHEKRAVQPSRRHVRRALFGGAWMVLWLSQLLRLRRSELSSLVRAALLAALGIWIVNRVASANPGQGAADSAIATLVACTPCLAAILLLLAFALRRGQEEVHWLRASLGISTRRMRVSSLLVLLTIGALFSLLLLLLPMPSIAEASSQTLVLFAYLLLHTFFWSSVASLLAYRVSGRGKDQTPALLALCIALADMLMIGVGGPWYLALELGVSVLILSRIFSHASERQPSHA